METQLLAEHLEHKRFNWIKWNLAGFALWDGTRLVQQYALTERQELITTPLIVLGAAIWVWSLVKILSLSGIFKAHPKLQAILNDEMVTTHRWKAFRVGFWALLLTQGLIQIVSFFQPFSALLGAELSIFIGVVSASAAFLVYHR